MHSICRIPLLFPMVSSWGVILSDIPFIMNQAIRTVPCIAFYPSQNPSLFCPISARAELDGNLPRPPNALTIIQVKNPEKNLDSTSSSKNNASTTYSSSPTSGLTNAVFFTLSHTRRAWQVLTSMLRQKTYRVTQVVADLGWVDLNFDVPLSALFCWGS